MSIQWPLVLFSILIGMSSGMVIFTAYGEIKGKFAETRYIASLAALIILILGGCISALHLGHPERALHILGNVSSGLSRELFCVGGLAVSLFVYVILVKKKYEQPAKIFSIISLILAVLLPLVAGASYVMPSRPAWTSFTLPLMYLGTGLGLGFLAMACIVNKKGAKEDLSPALKLAVAGVFIAAITIICYVIWLAIAPFPDPSRDIARLIQGDLAGWFWVGTIVCGVIIPIVLTAFALQRYEKAEAPNILDANKPADQEIVVPACKDISNLLFAAFAASVIGSIAIRVIMYLMASSVEQFFY